MRGTVAWIIFARTSQTRWPLLFLKNQSVTPRFQEMPPQALKVRQLLFLMLISIVIKVVLNTHRLQRCKMYVSSVQLDCSSHPQGLEPTPNDDCFMPRALLGSRWHSRRHHKKMRSYRLRHANRPKNRHDSAEVGLEAQLQAT